MGELRTQVKGLQLIPRKRHIPLKRYKVLVTLHSGGQAILIVRARNKKNACFFAVQEYGGVIKAKVLVCLGRCMERLHEEAEA